MATRISQPLQGIALNLQSGAAPDWVQLLPADGSITGRDGRRWTMPNPDAVVAAFNAASQKPHIDIEHSTQHLGAKGHPAPAVGWFEAVEMRADGLWGRVDWTEEGRNAVASRAYRYLSPVFRFNRSTGEIATIVSAGLTNNPNLDMAALNAAEEKDDATMDTAVLEALGLNANASTADAVVAITKLKGDRDTALNAAQTPDPEKFVPKADHDLALNRIKTFEEADKAREDEAINAAVDAAIEAGKIAPAQRDDCIAICQAEGGLDRFNAIVGAAAKITGGTSLDGKTPGAGKTALTAEELAVCQAGGMSEEDFIAAKGNA